MTHSKVTLPSHPILWRTPLGTGSPTTPVVPYGSYPLEACATQPPTDTEADAHAQPDLQSTPRPTLPAQAQDPFRPWYPTIMPAMQPSLWFHYDPARHPQPTLPPAMPTSVSMSGPHAPSPSPSLPVPVPVPVSPSVVPAPEPASALLATLQTQFSVFQDSITGVQLDIKDALSQLQALRTTQNKTDRSVAELERVIGWSEGTPPPRGRGRRGGRGKGGKASSGAAGETPLEGASADTGSEKTLVQSLAAIQAAVEVLLVRSGSESTSPICQSAAPSVDPTGQASPRTLEPTHLDLFQQRLPSASRVESSPSIAIPTPEPDTPPTAPEKDHSTEYADVSIQACTTSDPPYRLSQPERDTPGFESINWNVNPTAPGPSVGNVARPTAYTDEDFARILPNSNDPSATNTTTDGQTSRSDDGPPRSSSTSDIQSPARAMSVPPLSSHPTEPVVASVLPLVSYSSVDASGVPLLCGTHLVMKAPSPSTGVAQNSPSPAAEGVGSPLTPATPLASSLSSLTNTDGTSVSVSGTPVSEEHPGGNVQPPAELDSEDVQMASDTGGGSVTGGSKMLLEMGPTAPSHPSQASPVEADDGGMTSGLPTPPSETIADDGAMTHPADIARIFVPRNLPVIPTPPCLTPASSVGEDRGLVGGKGSARRSPSPLTPPLPSPLPAVVARDGSVARANSGEALEEPRGDAGGADHGGGEAAREVVRTEGSASAADSGVPNIDATHQRHEDSSWACREHQSDVAHADTTYFQMDGYDLSFSSPVLHPVCKAAPGHATPSESSTSLPTREEDEVSTALMFSASGVSTPSVDAACLPLMFSQHPSRASSVRPHAGQQSSSSPQELLAVDPSVLHGPMGMHFSEEIVQLGVHPVSTASLSSLTSLDDTDLDDREDASEADAGPNRKKSRTNVPPAGPSRSGSGESTLKARSRRSEPSLSSSLLDATSDAALALASVDVSVNGRSLGGPNASLDELTTLARRDPSKIYLRLPGMMRGAKRKRGVDDEGEEEGQGTSMGGYVDVSVGESVVAGSTGVSASAPPTGVGAAATPVVSQREPESALIGSLSAPSGNVPPEPSVSRKRTKQQSRRAEEAQAARLASERNRGGTSTKKLKRGSNRPPVKYHIRNGRLVAVEQELEPEPEPTRERTSEHPSQTHVPVPSISAPPVLIKEPSVDSSQTTRIRHAKGRENKSMKASLSSSAKSGRSSARSGRGAKSSSMKEEDQKPIKVGPEWPEFPSMFSHWDLQFIECDSCDMWFHYGCVGVNPGDPRLEPAALFVCPACHAQSTKRKTKRKNDDSCARPNCPESHVTEETEVFFVEKLVGRRRTEGYVFMWLAKWEGYPMSEATWIPKENLLGDGIKLFSTFLEDAAREGADLAQDLVLLQEAAEAGWGS